jgi:MFS family permease
MFDKFIIPPFIQNASEIFQTKYNLSLEESGTILSFPDIIYIVFGPILGFIIDKKGYKGIILLIGFLLVFISHVLLYSFSECA